MFINLLLRSAGIGRNFCHTIVQQQCAEEKEDVLDLRLKLKSSETATKNGINLHLGFDITNIIFLKVEFIQIFWPYHNIWTFKFDFKPDPTSIRIYELRIDHLQSKKIESNKEIHTNFSVENAFVYFNISFLSIFYELW